MIKKIRHEIFNDVVIDIQLSEFGYTSTTTVSKHYNVVTESSEIVVYKANSPISIIAISEEEAFLGMLDAMNRQDALFKEAITEQYPGCTCIG